MTRQDIIKALDSTADDGGYTWRPDGETGRYVVGNGNGATVHFPFNLPTEDIVECVRQTFNRRRSSAEGLGLWLNNGTLYIDIVVFTDDLATALQTGRFYNQQAIFDSETQTVIEAQ